MAFVMPLTFSAWQAMLNNFAVEMAGFTGQEIGILQSLREVPGFLSFAVVFLLLSVVLYWPAMDGPFVFDDYDSNALYATLEHALEVFEDREAWAQLIQRGMNRDFSWEKQVQRYEELYAKLLG